MTTKFLREEENFKLMFGSENNNWDSVTLVETLTDDEIDGLTDGMFLTPRNEEGEYDIADNEVPAYPILEEKFQFDNLAYGGFTVSKGAVPCFIKIFEGTPAKGDKLKVVAGVLNPIGVDEEHLAVAEVVKNYGDYLEITKLY